MQTENMRMYILVNGRVQGVGFRYFVQQQALQLGLCGWVRNLSNGGVYVLAEGPMALLEQLADAVRKGPPMAQVTECKVIWQEDTSNWVGFEILPDQ